VDDRRAHQFVLNRRLAVPGAPGYFLTTERLGFRAWRPDDGELAIGLWCDPEVARFLHAHGPPAAPDARARLAAEIALEQEHGFQYWPIFLRRGGAHVGCCGLRPREPDRAIHELGVHLRPAFWRRGLAVEAAGAVIDHAFARLGARALFAGHHPSNDASRRMLLRLGFRYTHAEIYPPTSLDHPCYLLEPTSPRAPIPGHGAAVGSAARRTTTTRSLSRSDVPGPRSASVTASSMLTWARAPRVQRTSRSRER
jgi:RimJ/RimL family protein N-acetyltransferase